MTQDLIDQWCKENGNIPYFETSAIQNTNVEDAFIQMAKNSIKRESSAAPLFDLPNSIGGAGGAIKLGGFDDKGAKAGVGVGNGRGAT